MMKKILISAITMFMAVLMLDAQSQLRYNYRKNGYIYSGCERERVEGSTPVYVKLCRVMFPDGQPVYQLNMYFEEGTAWKMPKNAPLTVRTVDGRTVILKNSADGPNLVAPSGVMRGKDRVYLNCGVYYLEEADLKKIATGISSMDATKRWTSDGVIKVTYKANELGSVIASQYGKLKAAPRPSAELGNNMKSLQDQHGSRLAETLSMKINGQLSAQLVYLYYAESDNESIDLNLYLAGKTVPFGASVTVVTKNGSIINLQQEKELTAGRIICYPTQEQYRSMLKGVASIRIETSTSQTVIDFPDNAFSNTLSTLYNSLMTVAIL